MNLSDCLRLLLQPNRDNIYKKEKEQEPLPLTEGSGWALTNWPGVSVGGPGLPLIARLFSSPVEGNQSHRTLTLDGVTL